MTIRFSGFKYALRASLGAVILSAAAASALTPVQKYGQLRVEGNKVLDQHGRPVVLNGMAFFWSQWQGQYYNANCVNWLVKDWKVTIVRASMAVDEGGYASNRGEASKVRAVVDAAIKEGIYVVIDFHVHEAQRHTELAKSFFKEMAQAYGHLPNVIYEPWNEPYPQHGWKDVIKPYHEAVIKTIREVDPDNLILCGTRSWAQDVDEASLDPITSSKNILYTLHYYAATHRQTYRDKALKALNNGIALMVTEGGLSEASGNGNVDTDEARKWQDFMTEHKISWMNWSVADKNESSAALHGGASASGGWSTGQLTRSGNWVRDNLRSLWDLHEKNDIVTIRVRRDADGSRLRVVAGGVVDAVDAMGRLHVGKGAPSGSRSGTRILFLQDGIRP